MVSAFVDMCSNDTASTTGGCPSNSTIQRSQATSASVEISLHPSSIMPTTDKGSIIQDILKDTHTQIMGGVIGAMLVLTVFVCIKTRVVQKKQKRSKNDHREHVSINLPPDVERVEERECNENENDDTNDHENYALVKPTEKCYVDLQVGEYDCLRSQRKHIQSSSEAKSEPCYDQFLKPSSLYDMTGESDKDNVFHPDYEYEIVKNINKKKSDSKNLKGLNFEIAPNVKRNTGYENTKAKNSPKASNDISLTNTKNRVRAKSTLL